MREEEEGRSGLRKLKWAEYDGELRKSTSGEPSGDGITWVGMAPAGAGAGLAKTRPQANPRDWKKPAREQTRGCISAPAPADFGRVSGARGSNNRYNKNVQIHQFKQSNNTFL